MNHSQVFGFVNLAEIRYGLDLALIGLEVFPVDRLIWLSGVLQVPPDSRLHGEVVG